MTLALIAGLGGLPPILAAKLTAQGHRPLICEMIGFPSQVSGDFDRLPFRLETLGTWLATLAARGGTQVCMAGEVRRPDVDKSLIDGVTAPLLPRLTAAMAKGDDGTLREMIAIFEEHGFSVIGAHQIAPELTPKADVYTKTVPPDLTIDLAVAVTALGEMGRADVGQAMLVRDARVIAREDQRGTEALLADFYDTTDGGGTAVDGDIVGEVVDWITGPDKEVGKQAPGTFLYKAPKPNQVMIADMPLIGPDTAKQAARAGLAGIVIAEGGVLVLNMPQVVAILDAHDMYLWVAP